MAGVLAHALLATQATAASLMQSLTFLQPDYQDYSQLPVEDFEELPEEDQVQPLFNGSSHVGTAVLSERITACMMKSHIMNLCVSYPVLLRSLGVVPRSQDAL